MYKLKDVCTICNTTKKAVNYYEKKGLIKPYKNEKGIRIFNDLDLKIIKCISFYRRLDYSLNEIKNLLESNPDAVFIQKTLATKREKVNHNIQVNEEKISSLHHLIINIDEINDIETTNYTELLNLNKNNFIEDTICLRMNGNWKFYTLYCRKSELRTLKRLANCLTIAMFCFLMIAVIYTVRGLF